MPVALVTGAARRLGRAIALELAHGKWHVAVHYHHSRAEAEATAQELRDLGVDADIFPADLADEQACRSLVPAAAARFGAVDAVVNSASRFEYDDAGTFSYAMLERHMRANVAPGILLAQRLAAHLTERGAEAASGVVVNLLDQKLWNPNPDHLSYTLSKAALRTATDLLARSLAPLVRVVGVAPGLTLPGHDMSQEEFDRLHRLAPLGLGSTAEEVARAVRFAVENRGMTGTTLVVDGGQHLMPLDRDFSRLQRP